MTPGKLHSDISAGKFKAVYYFFGSEDYRIVEAEKYVAGQFLPGRQMVSNFRRIDGKSTKCADLMAELSVYPMLGERQVFGVSNFQSYKPTEVDRVLKLLTPPDPNRVVILSSPSSKTPKWKSAFLAKLSKATEVVEFGKLTQSEMTHKIRQKLSQADLTIEYGALNMLMELMAGNLGALEMEISKLIGYKTTGEKITEADIREVSAGYQVYTVFELADAVIGGDVTYVLRQVERLLAGGNSPNGILFFLGQHFLSLYLVKNGKSLESRRRFLTSKFRSQASKYSNTRLEEIIIRIAGSDTALRQRKLKPELVLEQLVVELTATEK